MAEILIIPLTTAPHQEQTTTLDGKRFRLRVDWNGRLERWYFDLFRDDGTAIVQGKALVTSADLLRQYRADPTAPQGALTLVDQEGRDEEAGLLSLGTRHVLWYVVE